MGQRKIRFAAPAVAVFAFSLFIVASHNMSVHPPYSSQTHPNGIGPSTNASPIAARKNESPFVFTEEQSPFFSSNIQALKQALKQATAKGCVDWPSSERIHIIFQAFEAPITKFYIQIQVEQRTSAVFNSTFFDKLNSALQVWEFNADGAVDIGNRLPDVEAYYIPTTTYVRPFFHCPQNKKLSSQWLDEFESYKIGCYTKWKWKGSSFFAESLRPSSSWPDRHCSAPPMAAQLDPFPEVLLYGLIDGSHLNQRENLCDSAYLVGLNMACLQGIFNQTLEAFVCAAKVIVVESFYEQASLETHRIDHLILAGKIVVSTPSPDLEETYKYSKFVVFAEQNELLGKVQEILDDWAAWDKKAKMLAKEFKHVLENSLDPLCYALGDLRSAFERKNAKALSLGLPAAALS